MNSQNEHEDFDSFLDGYREFIAKIWSPTEPELLHAVWGFIGEVLELETNGYNLNTEEYYKEQIEEIGDLFYYLFTIERLTNTKIDWVSIPIPYADQTILHSAQRLSNIFKKHTWYGHELQPLNLSSIYSTLLEEIDNINEFIRNPYSPRKIIELNVEKLQKRYPDNIFTSKHAEQRLDKE